MPTFHYLHNRFFCSLMKDKEKIGYVQPSEEKYQQSHGIWGIVPQWTSSINTYSCTENYPKSLFGRRLSRHSDPVWKTLQLAMLFLAWHGEMTTLPFLLKESCSLWGQGRRFTQDQKVTWARGIPKQLHYKKKSCNAGWEVSRCSGEQYKPT